MASSLALFAMMDALQAGPDGAAASHVTSVGANWASLSARVTRLTEASNSLRSFGHVAAAPRAQRYVERISVILFSAGAK
jgi:hypothetical protein